MAWKTLLVALALTLPVWSQEDEKKKEEEAKARIAEFKKELKGAKTDGDVAKSIEKLGELQHPKIVAELKNFLGKSIEMASAAGEQLGKYKKDKDAAEALMTGAGARKDKEGIVKCLRYAGDTTFKGIAPKLIGYFKHRDVDVAKEAIDSLAKIKTASSIDPLINLWRELDGIRDDQKDTGAGGGLGGGLGGGVGGAGGVGVGNSVQEEQLRRKGELTGAVDTALGKITGESFKTSREASDWWRKAKGTFKDPE